MFKGKRMSALYPVLQHNDHYYIDMDIYIYTSPLKYPHLTVAKARPDFGPASFGISNNIRSLVQKDNIPSKSLGSARFERDKVHIFVSLEFI